MKRWGEKIGRMRRPSKGFDENYRQVAVDATVGGRGRGEMRAPRGGGIEERMGITDKWPQTQPCGYEGVGGGSGCQVGGCGVQEVIGKRNL